MTQVPMFCSRGHDARDHWYFVCLAPFYYLRVEARADDKFCSGFHGAVRLLDCEHSSGSHQHLREFFAHNADGFFCRIGAEGHLGAGKSALAESFGKRLCFCCIL